MRRILLIFFAVELLVVTCFSANANRFKRGFLSRTGVCPDPNRNFQKRDRRLNYFGNALEIKKGRNKDVTCVESECIEDSHCDADRKCCKNRCGGMVCTRAARDPHPCENFQCPSQQTCKIQRVKCIMPECQDTYAVNRPTCVPNSEATVLLHDDNRIAPPPPPPPMADSTTAAPHETTPNQGSYGSYGNGQQPYYGNNYQQTAGTNNYAAPQTNYYATNQEQTNSYGTGQVPNWQQNYQTQQG